MTPGTDILRVYLVKKDARVVQNIDGAKETGHFHKELDENTQMMGAISTKTRH